MLFGDTNELDIDGRNCNGDMLGDNETADYRCIEETQPIPKTKLEFKSVEEMLQSAEVRELIRKTIAHKDQQIRELQNELLELSEFFGPF